MRGSIRRRCPPQPCAELLPGRRRWTVARRNEKGPAIIMADPFILQPEARSGIGFVAHEPHFLDAGLLGERHDLIHHLIAGQLIGAQAQFRLCGDRLNAPNLAEIFLQLLQRHFLIVPVDGVQKCIAFMFDGLFARDVQ